MTKSALTDGDLYLSYLEALDDEYWALLGQSPAPSTPRREAYRAARRRVDAASGSGDDERNKAQIDVERAEMDFRHDLLRRVHAARRSAICFSGGGIRSATFGLGILQGLAAHSADGGPRPQLLGEFDYLSTVSGGGYLGSWFSAWAAREASSDPGPGGGVTAVIRKLAKNPDLGFDPEPPAVAHLRGYSNYLIPRLGLLSGDTWAVIGTVVRNMFLNWLVLLPLVAVILLIPEGALRVLEAGSPDWVKWTVLSAGFAFGVLATAYIGFDLPSAGNARGNYARYVGFCLLPLILSAVLLNTFWGWLGATTRGAQWWYLVSPRGVVNLWHFVLFGATMHAGGMLAGIGAAKARFHRPATRTGLIATVAAFITGGLGGLVMFVLISRVIPDGIYNKPLYICVAFPLVVAVFLFAGALLVGLTSYITEDKDREWWARSGGMLLSVGLAWVAFAAVVLYSEALIQQLTWKLSSFAAVLSGWATARLGSSAETAAGRREEVIVAPSIATVKELASRLALPIFLFALVLILARANAALLLAVRQPAVPILAVAYLVISLGSSYFINVNSFSLHAMYKLRLVRAYLGASNRHRKQGAHRFTGFDEQDDVQMCKLSAQKPLHVVNMALNLVGGTNLAWQHRKAESFTSTRLHTGSCRVGYRRSDVYGGRYDESAKTTAKTTPISLGTAMTISGAAASPNMGYNSSPLLTIVMTLFNARLGWWLGNPANRNKYWKYPGPAFGVRPFLDEALGLTDDRNRWVYLSDGGHFENLGLYEMVIRRCGLIVVCDAGADPKFGFEDLGNAVRKVRVDLGISIEFDGPMPVPFKNQNGTHAGPHCAIGRIRYDTADPNSPADGTLIYIKASLTGDEPPDVRHYASQNPLFPHETTTDQFFDEAQFESYRRLGLHIIERICDQTSKVSPPNKTFDLAEFIARARIYSETFGRPADEGVLPLSAGPLTRVWQAVSDAWTHRTR